MEILYFLASLRNPVTDFFFSAVTHLGGEIGIIVLALLFFWCLDKREGYYLFLVGFVGTLFNQFLKLVFRVERPWVADPDFKPIESAIEDASGYSFPSGHTQSSVGIFGGIARVTRRRAVRILCIVLAVLVPFSRLYLGVHTPADVLCSVAIALLLVFLLHPLVDPAKPRRMAGLLGGVTLLAAAYLLFVLFFPFPADIDAQNLASGVKNAYTMLGVLVGLDVVYFVDHRYLHSDTRAPLAGQAVKYLLGLAVALAIKEGLRAPLTALFGAQPQNFVRYFLLVIFAGIVWPLLFPYFKKIGAREASEKENKE